MALNFRQPSNTIVTQDKYSRLHIDSRATSIFKKTFKVTKFGAKVGFKSAELVGKTSYDVLKQQIKAPADSRNNNDTLADSQGGAVKTSLKNASSLGHNTGTSIGKNQRDNVDGEDINVTRKALGHPTKPSVTTLTAGEDGARSHSRTRRPD